MKNWPINLWWCILGALVAERRPSDRQVLICGDCGSAWCRTSCPRLREYL